MAVIRSDQPLIRPFGPPRSGRGRLFSPQGRRVPPPNLPLKKGEGCCGSCLNILPRTARHLPLDGGGKRSLARRALAQLGGGAPHALDQ